MRKSPAILDFFDRLYFYSSHLEEILTEIFGRDVRAVTASEKNGNLSVLFHYDSYNITASYHDHAATYGAMVATDKQVIHQSIDNHKAYSFGAELFADMVRTGKMPMDPAELVKSVDVLMAIEHSYLSGGKRVDVVYGK